MRRKKVTYSFEQAMHLVDGYADSLEWLEYAAKMTMPIGYVLSDGGRGKRAWVQIYPDMHSSSIRLTLSLPADKLPRLFNPGLSPTSDDYFFYLPLWDMNRVRDILKLFSVPLDKGWIPQFYKVQQSEATEPDLSLLTEEEREQLRKIVESE